MRTLCSLAKGGNNCPHGDLIALFGGRGGNQKLFPWQRRWWKGRLKFPVQTLSVGTLFQASMIVEWRSSENSSQKMFRLSE